MYVNIYANVSIYVTVKSSSTVWGERANPSFSYSSWYSTHPSDFKLRSELEFLVLLNSFSCYPSTSSLLLLY